MPKDRSGPPPKVPCKACKRMFPSKFAMKHHPCQGDPQTKLAEQLLTWANGPDVMPPLEVVEALGLKPGDTLTVETEALT